MGDHTMPVTRLAAGRACASLTGEGCCAFHQRAEFSAYSLYTFSPLTCVPTSSFSLQQLTLLEEGREEEAEGKEKEEEKRT